MTQFLYFVPGHPLARLDRVTVANTFAVTALRDLLRSDKSWNADAVTFNALTQDGPGGKVGTLFACLPGGMAIEGFDVDYRPAVQTWVEIGNAWLGWYTDKQPTEESLRKPAVVTGYPVRLNDECDWHAPTIRCMPVGSRVTLPRAITLGADGHRVVGVQEFYLHWQTLVAKLWDYRFGIVTLSGANVIDAAAELLSLNYRVGPKEIDALGLFDLVDPASNQNTNFTEIILAAYDWPIVQDAIDQQAAKKKSQLETSELTVGSEAATKPAAV